MGSPEKDAVSVTAIRVSGHFRSTDLLLCNVHELHGNFNFVASGPFERLSCVFYLRPKIVTQTTGATAESEVPLQ